MLMVAPQARLELCEGEPERIFRRLPVVGGVTGTGCCAALIVDQSAPRVYLHAGISGEALALEAVSLGLGCCWINRAIEEFESEEGKALLKKWGIEGEWIGVGHCILGYPAGDPQPAAPRKSDYILKV